MRKVGYHSSPTLIPTRQTRQILNVVPLSVSSSVASSHHLRAPGAFITHLFPRWIIALAAYAEGLRHSATTDQKHSRSNTSLPRKNFLAFLFTPLSASWSGNPFQCVLLMNRDVVRFIALDDVLRFILRSMVHIAFEAIVRDLALNDHSALLPD